MLTGLARVIWNDDPQRARALAEEALGWPGSLDHPFAVATAGWLRLVAGDIDNAAELAGRAVELAGCRRNAGPLADALELTALASADRNRRPALLEEAASARAADGDVVGEARCRLAHACSSTGRAARRLVVSAKEVLARSGVRTDGTPALGVQALLPLPRPLIVVRCLGRFEVHRGGEPVQTSEWQSRKAHDLLKLLAARRGRAVAREKLMDVLWPDVEPDALGNRLAVVIATLRRVLDPDRSHPIDHFVTVEDGSLTLDLDHVELDIAVFLDDVAEAQCAAGAGRTADARNLLHAAISAYRGDAFEEEPYADWASPLREEDAQRTRRSTPTAPHAVQRRRRRVRGPLRQQRQLLNLDPYDEVAHHSCIDLLAASGRYGEARRARAAYTSRMAELGLPRELTHQTVHRNLGHH